MLNIVLLEPEMPANTGNIGRTCCATGTKLHLIEPMGFKINDKTLKRAGLDYWEKLDVTVYDCLEDFLEKDAYIMFGKESAGIPEELLVEYQERAIRIPMNEEIRSLNLSNSVAIVLYEALRQNNFFSMQLGGTLHRLQWKN